MIILVHAFINQTNHSICDVMLMTSEAESLGNPSHLEYSGICFLTYLPFRCMLAGLSLAAGDVMLMSAQKAMGFPPNTTI